MSPRDPVSFPLSTANSIPVFSRWLGSWQVSLRRRVLSPQQLMEQYDRAAENWTRTLDRLGTPSAYEDMLATVLSEYSVVSDGPLNVLDCGVGTGCLSAAFLRATDMPINLEAIDVSEAMLHHAEKSLSKIGIRGSFRQCDVRQLPYEDNSIDVVLSAHLLEHLPDPGEAIVEMARVLKPGGLMIVCMTTTSLLGAYIQLKWRTHRVKATQAEALLRRSGLYDVRSVRMGGNRVASKMSIACVGRKAPNARHLLAVHDHA